MAGEGTDGSTILVLDDHYAVQSDEFYSCNDFERDFGALPFRFVYSPAWDDSVKQYTVAAALRDITSTKPQGILLDVMFGSNRTDRLGVDILREVTRKHPEIPVVMMTSVVRDELWMECTRLGAVDYLVKPMSDRLLAQTLHRYVGVEMKHWLIGQNKHFLDAINLAAMAAEGKRTPVMISGETGTGKELIASFVHRHGRGANTPFKVIYLPTITPDLQADALFGHSKGAFTGADRDRPGAFQNADGGVVFLDEIGDINTDAQVRLLRVVDSGEVTRLGDGKTGKVNVQIVSATNADLAKKLKANEFRYDLWTRLSGMHVALPSLEQRREDIPLLVRHLLRCEALERYKANLISVGERLELGNFELDQLREKISYCEVLRERHIPNLPEHLEGMLREFPWQGNVRGLLAYVQRVFDLAGGEIPDEKVFLAALPQLAELTISRPLIHQADERVGASLEPLKATASAERIQHLRLEELGLLHQVLLETRHRVTGVLDRANAAALLKGKPKCSTNEFDRWIKRLWRDLDADSRAIAVQRFPEILPVVGKIPDDKEYS